MKPPCSVIIPLKVIERSGVFPDDHPLGGYNDISASIQDRLEVPHIGRVTQSHKGANKTLSKVTRDYMKSSFDSREEFLQRATREYLNQAVQEPAPAHEACRTWLLYWNYAVEGEQCNVMKCLSETIEFVTKNKAPFCPLFETYVDAVRGLANRGMLMTEVILRESSVLMSDKRFVQRLQHPISVLCRLLLLADHDTRELCIEFTGGFSRDIEHDTETHHGLFRFDYCRTLYNKMIHESGNGTGRVYIDRSFLPIRRLARIEMKRTKPVNAKKDAVQTG